MYLSNIKKWHCLCTQVIIAGLLLAHQLGAYTWKITNNTGVNNAEIEVCTTPGIESCQTKILKDKEIGEFQFAKWYNTGLCLREIKINGKKVKIETSEKEIALYATAGALSVISGGVSGLIGSAYALANYCRSANLAIITDKGKEPVAIGLSRLP